MDKLAGLATQIRDMKKRLKELDTKKANPAKVKEITDVIKDLEKMLEDKKQKQEERKKKKQESSETPKTEASVVPTEVVKESAPAPTEEVVKEADVTKFAVDSKVEPIRGTPGSWGVIIREAGTNGDPLCYVKWMEGTLKTAHGDYGAYYPSDLRLKVEAKSPTDYVPREEVYNLEADYKGKLSAMIKDLEEEIKTAYDKGEAVWAARLEQKLADAKKALEEKSDKTAEDENGSGGSTRLKVYDQNPPYDKDPQEKSTGYGGDRPMGAMVAPNSDENSLPLESSLSIYKGDSIVKTVKDLNHAIKWLKDNERIDSLQRAKELGYDLKPNKEASLNKSSINITVAEKLFVVNPLAKTADNEYVYDVSLSDNSKLFKITSKDEMGQEHLAYVIEKELLNHKEATNKEAKNKCVICNEEFASWPEYDEHRKAKHGPKTSAQKEAADVVPETGTNWPELLKKKDYKPMDLEKKKEVVKRFEKGNPAIIGEQKEAKKPSLKLAKLTSNLAFLRKGTTVVILDVIDKEIDK